MDEFKIFLSQFDFQFDCIVLTETRKIENECIFNLSGYKMLYNKGNLNQNDDTVVYIKTDIYKHHELIHFNDSVLLRLEVEFFGNPIIVHALYRSPSTCINQFNQNLQDYLDTQAMDDHKCNFIVGDINIDILDENDNKVSDYLTVMAEYGYKSLINAPTRLETYLDHIFMK